MMTSNLIERGARWWRLAVLALLVSLAGCGPGTGGTGTGPVAFGFSGSSGGAVFAPSAGAAGCDRICQINLLLEDQRIELESSCSRFVHTGGWKVDDQGLLVVNGTVAQITAKGTVSAPGTLRLQFSSPTAASSQVTITVLDAAGTTLLGPLQLRNDPAVTGGSAPQPSCSPT